MKFSILGVLFASTSLLCCFGRLARAAKEPRTFVCDGGAQRAQRRCIHEARNVLNSLSLNIHLLEQLGSAENGDTSAASDSRPEVVAQCRRDVKQLRRLLDSLSGQGGAGQGTRKLAVGERAMPTW